MGAGTQRRKESEVILLKQATLEKIMRIIDSPKMNTLDSFIFAAIMIMIWIGVPITCTILIIMAVSV